MNPRSDEIAFCDCEGGSFYIELPMKNIGRFRWKKRSSSREYGQSLSTSTEPYSQDSYIEWQIGYDFEAKEQRQTRLDRTTFRGANGKIKLPYELSEIIYHMMERGLLSEKELDELIKTVENSNSFLDEQYEIKTETVGSIDIGGIRFIEETISLPTFVYEKEEGEPVIEVSIQKQQYATGVQPMVYLSIPILCLKDGNSYISRTYKYLKESDQTGSFLVNEATKDYFTTLFKVFGICSKKHNHDVGEILRIVRDYPESSR